MTEKFRGMIAYGGNDDGYVDIFTDQTLMNYDAGLELDVRKASRKLNMFLSEILSDGVERANDSYNWRQHSDAFMKAHMNLIAEAEKKHGRHNEDADK